MDSEKKTWWGQPKMSEYYPQIETSSQVFREREGGEGKETGDSEVLGPRGRESSSFECGYLRSIVFEDCGLYRLLGY